MNMKRFFGSKKAKYRCKLCGQFKQNHICPYKNSLERSIGTMSFAAINSFECAEPGNLAPSLAEMNNFFHLISDDEESLSSDESYVSKAKTSIEMYVDIYINLFSWSMVLMHILFVYMFVNFRTQ